MSLDATLTHLRDTLGGALALRWLPQCESTNTTLLGLARLGLEGPVLLGADVQTAGRGRQGRVWHSAPGDSLTFSLAWPWASGRALDALSLATGLCLAKALDPAGTALRLKWPNDLWLRDEGKLGGVLVETLGLNGQGSVVVLGIGLNLAPPAQALDQPTRGLRQLDARWQRDSLLQAVVPPLVTLLQRFQGFDAAQRAAFARRDALHGAWLRAGTLEGVAEGVAEDGSLCLRDAAGRLHPVRAGEVRVQRPVALKP